MFIVYPLATQCNAPGDSYVGLSYPMAKSIRVLAARLVLFLLILFQI